MTKKEGRTKRAGQGGGRRRADALPCENSAPASGSFSDRIHH